MSKETNFEEEGSEGHMTKKNDRSFLSVLDQTTLPKSGTKALERLQRLESGESIEQITKADGVTEKTVRDSLNEARHLTRTAVEQRVLDPIVAMTERLPLKQAEHALYHHYERARRAYENYKQSAVEQDT